MISPSLLLKPHRIVDPTSWVGHIPFAFWIIEAAKPTVFVELGTHSGNSYFAFCQSVVSNRLPTRCYAIDTWQGDEHAGFYDDTIFEEVLSHNENCYSGFSSLLRMTFDQALEHFSNGSIDLLHIDGLHTYDAVKHDFETWLPKLSPCGIVLFHDVNVRERNFGVWQFWEEIAARYPHIGFDHSHGLGVLIVGSEQKPAIGKIVADFESASGEHLIKALVSRLGHMIKLEHQITKLHNAAAERDAYIETLSRAIAEHDTQIGNCNTSMHRHQAEELERQLDKLLHSSSWRMTKPIRKITHSVRKRARKVRKLFFKLFGIIESIDTATTPPLNKEHEREKAEHALSDFLSKGETISFVHMNEKPKVTILIVLFNQAGLSLLCLKTLEAIKNVDYEIIIVDNASTDRVQELLYRIEGARILRNHENEGFLRAVNQGAKFAEGEYLVLLNNDALLFPDTLSNAVACLDNNSSAGAVGGQILLWNGLVQESGSIIWKDGSCLGYGRNDDPHKFEYRFTRHVDYCSGAFLMIRNHLFKALEGFDTDYSPAYYEDTDFCVRLWKSGYSVMYDPSVKIRHFEFASTGKSTEWALEMQKKNRTIFADKHSDFLADQLAPESDNILDARMRLGKGGQRILFIDDRIPHPTFGSGYPRANAFIKSIVQSGHFVTFLPLQFPEQEVEREPCNPLPESIEVAYGIGCNKLEKFLLDRRLYYDFIVVSRPHNVKELNKVIQRHPQLLHNLKIICDAEAIFCLRDISKADAIGKPISAKVQSKMIADELSLYQYANTVVTVSDRERLYFSTTTIPSVRVLGHTIEKVEMPAKCFHDRFGFLFVGAIQSDDSPNGDSLIWFLKEVWPLITKKIKNARLDIIGLCNSYTIKAFACSNIIVHGRLHDIASFYENARVFIAPTRFAAGIPHKAHESAAHGLPIVSSPIIALQLGWEDIILSGGSSQEFSRHCVTLHESPDLWSLQQASILKQIELDCSPIIFQETVTALFN